MVSKMIKKFTCEICNIEASDQSSLQLHLKGKRHKSKESTNCKFICELCDIQTNDKSGLKAHFNGQKHKKRHKEVSKKVSLILHLTQGKGGYLDEKDLSPENFECKICDIETNGQIALEEHCQGKRHKKKIMEISNSKPKFVCNICDIEASDKSSLESHFKGKIHMKKENPKVIENFKCEICNIETSNFDGLEYHYRGKKHHKRSLLYDFCRELMMSCVNAI